MSVRSYYRGAGGDTRAAASFAPQCLRVLWVSSSFILILAAVLTSTIAAAHNQNRQPLSPEKRIHYQIQLALDYESRTYTGTERVRWINRGDHPTSTLFFHLYPNVRMPSYLPPTENSGSSKATSDEPRLEISEVRIVGSKAPLQFALDDQETTLRINLREAIAPEAAVGIELRFRGSVPEIDPEETGLVAHVFQQVSAAIR